MPKLRAIPNVWRVLSEVDLESIRRSAERPFQVLITGEPEQALALAHALTGDPEALHPWLLVSTPEDATRQARSGFADLAVVVTLSPDLDETTRETAAVVARAGVPVLTVVLGRRHAVDEVVRAPETARVAVTDLQGPGLARVVAAVLANAPESARLGLARHLPPLRGTFIADLVEETARANAVYSLSTGIAENVPFVGVPLGIADVFVLTKNQLVMGYRIALAAGKQGRPRDLVGEVIGVVGGGLLMRQGARQLIGLIPVAGLIPKVAIAYAGTWAIGRAVGAWAVHGERISPGAIRDMQKQAGTRGRDLAARLLRGGREEERAG